jgi:hypothetical protein
MSNIGQLWFGTQGELPENRFQPNDYVRINHPTDKTTLGYIQDVQIVEYWRNGQWTVRELKNKTTFAIDAKYLSLVKKPEHIEPQWKR